MAVRGRIDSGGGKVLNPIGGNRTERACPTTWLKRHMRRCRLNLPGEPMNRSATNVPITMGSPTFRSLGLDGFEVTEAWFPAREVLADHTHNRACVAVML